MADIIFPNTYGDDSFESESMFKGIDWDNFNQKLAEVKEAKDKEVTRDVEELLKSLEKSNPSKFHDTVNELMGNDAEDKKEPKAGWRAAKEKCEDCGCAPCTCNVKEAKARKCPKCGEKCKSWKKDCVHCGEPNPYYNANMKNMDDSDDEKDAEMIKRAPVAFTHPSQLSAEAVEAALAAGDKVLANTILAARHERRVRLANKIQKTVQAQEEKAVKLAQRKAYRESLVKSANVSSKSTRATKVVASKSVNNSTDGFVKISEMNRAAKAAFAEKALSEGFPMEYVTAVLGEAYNSAEKTEEIKRVMSSSLEVNVKKAAVKSMVKTATLSNADYTRVINYWKNELGYGDVEWINELFTKKYD